MNSHLQRNLRIGDILVKPKVSFFQKYPLFAEEEINTVISLSADPFSDIILANIFPKKLNRNHSYVIVVPN